MNKNKTGNTKQQEYDPYNELPESTPEQSWVDKRNCIALAITDNHDTPELDSPTVDAILTKLKKHYGNDYITAIDPLTNKPFLTPIPVSASVFLKRLEMATYNLKALKEISETSANKIAKEMAKLLYASDFENGKSIPLDETTLKVRFRAFLVMFDKIVNGKIPLITWPNALYHKLANVDFVHPTNYTQKVNTMSEAFKNYENTNNDNPF